MVKIPQKFAIEIAKYLAMCREIELNVRIQFNNTERLE
jgi:hypothetical protein